MLPDGSIRWHWACFIEEHDDGSITLYGRDKPTQYLRHEYRQWILDDIQIEEPD